MNENMQEKIFVVLNFVRDYSAARACVF